MKHQENSVFHLSFEIEKLFLILANPHSWDNVIRSVWTQLIENTEMLRKEINKMHDRKGNLPVKFIPRQEQDGGRLPFANL